MKCVNLYDDDNSEDFIFRSLSYLKSRNQYILKGTKPISFTRTKEVLLEMLYELGLDKTKFGLHSLKSGGCTAVYRTNYSNVTDVGVVKKPKMATLKTALTICYQFLEV